MNGSMPSVEQLEKALHAERRAGITHSVTVTTDEAKAEAGNRVLADTSTLEIVNNSGAVLPETGGVGTTLFYLVGGLMTVGSALVLIVRRRADAEEE